MGTLGHSDDELMVRVQEGDDQAFSTLLDRHLSAIHAFAFRMLRNAEDAEDVAQDVFVRIWNKSGTYQPGRVQFTTWLHQVACVGPSRRLSTLTLTPCLQSATVNPEIESRS
ncbi:MAG: hypothetical protein J4F97_05560 [Pseudomonadales bacterium]|nr:hypothetical protein [Pseudomonadales bacterium]